jgi:hypothetical protein
MPLMPCVVCDLGVVHVTPTTPVVVCDVCTRVRLCWGCGFWFDVPAATPLYPRCPACGTVTTCQ